MLLKLYEHIFYEDSLSESQKMSYITLICKDPVNHDNVKNYRPISLMKAQVWSIPIILLVTTDILLQINLLKILTSIFIKLIEKFNFGPKLMKWIKILYHDLNSCIIVNKFISQPVKISRSVKQGCSLSPLLYVLCLEPFVRKVCKDKEIEGLKLPGSPDQCKISVFAELLPFKAQVWSIPIILLVNTDILLQINLLKILTSIFIKLIGL
jgi:hypothetical protein